MSNNDISSMERDIEETRDRLAATIDELVHRASPKTIARREVTSLKAHFVDLDSGEPRTDNILKVAGAVAGLIVFLAAVRRLSR